MNALADMVATTDLEDSPIMREARRVASLPIAGVLTPEEVDAISRAEVTSAAYAEGFRAWEVQARTLLSVMTGSGAAIPASVGAGKSNCGFLAAKHWWRTGARKMILHVPSRAVVQTISKKIPQAWRVFGIDIPVHNLAGLVPEKRRKLAATGWRGLYIMPYSLLSADDADDVLAAIDPDGVIADECHHIALRAAGDQVKASARAKRWLAMMRKRKRKLLAMSGTMDAHCVRDSQHLLALALGDGCPLPIETVYLKMWADVLDDDRPQEPDPERIRGLMPVLEFAIDAVRRGRVLKDAVSGPLTPDPQGLRRAYRLRRDTTHGIVASSGTDADGAAASLNFRNFPILGGELTQAEACDLELRHPAYDADDPRARFVPAQSFASMDSVMRVKALLWAVARRSRTPSGDVIQHAFHGFKWQTEISSGFYNEQVWPTAHDLVQKRGISIEDAEDVLKRSVKQFEKWQVYCGHLRRFLDDDHVKGLDTPELVGNEIKHHGARRLPEKLVKAWQLAKGLVFDGMVARVSRQERVSDWKIRHAIEWARREVPEGKGAVVWVYNVELGQWAYELFLKEFGVDRVLHCPESKRADNDFADPKRAGTRLCVTSLPAHFQSKDLEYFEHQFFLQAPRVAKMAQQSIGRLHRHGQLADELNVDFCLSTNFDHQNYSAMLRDAVYAHVTDQPQKVVYGDYESTEAAPFPRKYPPSFLEEQGFEKVRRLGPGEERFLADI